ncbi:MAG: response regulator [Candidatus Liptonbacteria bacterium]|nr:response regulator [Candidatus Liptonbacteria bacterium]
MPTAGRKIMVIEDDRFLSTVIKARLEKMGVEVTQAFDGEEAIKELSQGKPDLIILDLVMPRVTGFEVLDKISKTPELKDIPIVVLSHLAQDSDIEKARQMGAATYFVKVKVSIDEVINKVASLVQ